MDLFENSDRVQHYDPTEHDPNCDSIAPAMALVPRATIAQICQRRDEAIRLFGVAYDALASTSGALDAARKAAGAASNGVNRFNYHSESAKQAFLGGLKVPTRTDFTVTARKMIDTDIWAHVIGLVDIERFMDKKAKDEFTQQLMSDPPAATEENIFATLLQFSCDADMIFRRGIAECFSNLDRRFRSHDGWKIGSRVILSHAFDENGWWNYHRNHRDSIRDIERTFAVLDGIPDGALRGHLEHQIDLARRGGHYARQTEIETDYFKVFIYKNGNAHLWFKRDDLVRQVNKLLAEYYGEIIPEERRGKTDEPLKNAKTTLAKNMGFFPTPEAAAAIIMHDIPLYRDKSKPRYTVLEPSAGTGNLAELVAAEGAIVDCIELHGDRAEGLRKRGIYRKVTEADFLAVKPNPSQLYDRVVMNPPFDLERDIDHVMHALDFLKPDGFLTAIMSAGTEFRETRKSVAFRELMTKMNARWHDLPAGSFASVGTYTNTVVLRVWKDRRTFW